MFQSESTKPQRRAQQQHCVQHQRYQAPAGYSEFCCHRSQWRQHHRPLLHLLKSNQSRGVWASLAFSCCCCCCCYHLPRTQPRLIPHSATQLAHAAGVPVVLDAGGAADPLPPQLLRCLAVISPNETELQGLTGGQGGQGSWRRVSGGKRLERHLLPAAPHPLARLRASPLAPLAAPHPCQPLLPSRQACPLTPKSRWWLRRTSCGARAWPRYWSSSARAAACLWVRVMGGWAGLGTSAGREWQAESMVCRPVRSAAAAVHRHPACLQCSSTLPHAPAAAAADAEGQVWREQARKVERVVDTTGAGASAYWIGWRVDARHAASAAASPPRPPRPQPPCTLSPSRLSAPTHPTHCLHLKATASPRHLQWRCWRGAATGKPCALPPRRPRSASRWVGVGRGRVGGLCEGAGQRNLHTCCAGSSKLLWTPAMPCCRVPPPRRWQERCHPCPAASRWTPAWRGRRERQQSTALLFTRLSSSLSAPGTCSPQLCWCDPLTCTSPLLP